MTNLTPYGKRILGAALGIILLIAAAFLAPKIGVEPKALIDAGLRLISETPEPPPAASPVPSATVSPEQEASLY